MRRSRGLIRGTALALLLCLGISFYSQRTIFAITDTTQGAASVPVGSLPPQIAESQVVGNLDLQRILSLSINLSLNHVSALQQYIRGLYTPGSYLYHHYLRPGEFAILYGPSARDVQQVSDYLQAQGFTITHSAAGEQVIDFTGSVAQAERAFGVQINMYRAKDGHLFYANSTAPRIPTTLRALIQHVGGLSDALVRQHPALHLKTVTLCKDPLHCGPISFHPNNLQAVFCPGPGSAAAKYYTPAQFATAYNFAGFYQAGYHGEGQNVALFELDSFTPSDIVAYQSCFDANAPTRVNTALIDGGPVGRGAGSLEVELDMEVLLGMLPRLSNLFVYEAPNTDTGYNDAWMRILNDDIPVVSTSWGMCELNLSASDILAEQQFFMQAAAQGQSLIASSGDFGAYDCGDSTLAVDDPASNPYITGVGGTHLTLNKDSTYNTESGWSNTPGLGYASGGGISQLWNMPYYQSGPGVINSHSSGSSCHAPAGKYCRQVPDVAVNTDPNTGYIVYCTIVEAACQPSAPFVHIGGTSAAAPMWAAATALANQYALAHGGYNLGLLNPVIYSLLNSSTLYGRAFHDVTNGSNLYYSAAPGYDMVTGVGTYNAYAFAVAAATVPGPRQVPARVRWYFAEGHIGNQFQEYLTLENPSINAPAHVVINYLLRGRPSTNQALTINASTRMTVSVNNVLGVDRNSSVGQDVSLYITSDMPIVTERPMYFVYGGTTRGGSDIVGATQPGQHFTFANGETLAGFTTYLSVLNPPGQPQATVVASYYSSGVMIGQSTLIVPAGQRNTLQVNRDLPAGKQFLIQVDATQPVVVERPLYFRISVPGIAGIVAGGSSVAGVSPALDWYFPDGYTGRPGAPTQENLVLANPDANGTGAPAAVTVTYALANGTTKTINVSVPARSQLIKNVNTDVGPGILVAMKVFSTNGITIVAERQEFFSFPSLTPTPTGVEVVGTTSGGHSLSTVYSFAEGHLGGSFSEYVTLFNPNSSAILVSVTYFITHGTTQYLSQEQVSIPPMGVAQVNANTFLNIPATAASGVAADTSLVVQSLPNSNGAVLPLVAERSLYFTFAGTMPGSTSVVGYSGT